MESKNYNQGLTKCISFSDLSRNKIQSICISITDTGKSSKKELSRIKLAVKQYDWSPTENAKICFREKIINYQKTT